MTRRMVTLTMPRLAFPRRSGGASWRLTGRLTNRPHDMLVPSGGAARKGGEASEARGGSPDQANARNGGADAGFRPVPHDRSRRPDGRRQDQDRTPPGGPPQSAVLRFGYRDR